MNFISSASSSYHPSFPSISRPDTRPDTRRITSPFRNMSKAVVHAVQNVSARSSRYIRSTGFSIISPHLSQIYTSPIIPSPLRSRAPSLYSLYIEQSPHALCKRYKVLYELTVPYHIYCTHYTSLFTSTITREGTVPSRPALPTIPL